MRGLPPQRMHARLKGSYRHGVPNQTSNQRIYLTSTKTSITPPAPKLFDRVLSNQILDLVEPLLGPDFNLFATHFFCKPKGDGCRVPWHEDSAYWKGMLEPMEAVTVWLAIAPLSVICQ